MKQGSSRKKQKNELQHRSTAALRHHDSRRGHVSVAATKARHSPFPPEID